MTNLNLNHLRTYFTLFALSCSLTACTNPGFTLVTPVQVSVQIPIVTATTALATPSPCEDTFITHTLPFATGVRIREIRTYESNGAGVAINDLDGDGDLDLVFASIDREAAILWNEGDLTFVSEPLDAVFTRGVNIVDVDGDGLFDIVFTHRGLETLSFWRNQGADATTRFVRTPLPGVESYAYSMAWADLTGDGALDLVTGSYNIDLIQQGIDVPADDPHAGVFLYEQRDGQFISQRLAAEAEALAVALLDLDGDGQRDIWVANDFDVQDGVWLNQSGTWQASSPFHATSHSTMSIDWADIANNGRTALFTTDMMPYDESPETMAAWQPLMEAMMAHHVQVEGDPQVMANVLQMAEANGSWVDEAGVRGIAATGWSWASKFGDLDNDGFLDLYVVNGMIAENMLGHLPNGELVEENQALRNLGNGDFIPAPEWGLGSTASGRGMVMADLDDDGDLDIVVSNLRQSSQLLENRLCGGAGLTVELQWPGSPNSHAIGAQVELQTDRAVLRRDVRASGAYLSGDTVRVYFGFAEGTTLDGLNIIWPDGAVSGIEEVSPQASITVTRLAQPEG